MAKDNAARIRYGELIAGLARPAFFGELLPPAARIVMGFRILSICSKLRCDPLSEIAMRLDSITAAKALIHLAETVARCWPEKVCLYRPCAPVLTPDEATIARMVASASSGDRPAFGSLLYGFVRRERHAALFAGCAAAAAGADIAHR